MQFHRNSGTFKAGDRMPVADWKDGRLVSKPFAFLCLLARQDWTRRGRHDPHHRQRQDDGREAQAQQRRDVSRSRGSRKTAHCPDERLGGRERFRPSGAWLRHDLARLAGQDGRPGADRHGQRVPPGDQRRAVLRVGVAWPGAAKIYSDMSASRCVRPSSGRLRKSATELMGDGKPPKPKIAAKSSSSVSEIRLTNCGSGRLML